jgi:predicted  nucleic acid-binding Zn-ribbon protein
MTGAAGFGDVEPEDSWDPDDNLDELVTNLARRLVLLGVLDAELERDNRRRAVDELAELLEVARTRRDLTERDHVRIRQTTEDLEHVYRRLMVEGE